MFDSKPLFRILTLCLTVILFLSFLTVFPAYAQDKPRIIVFILDYLTLEDLDNPELANFNKIIDNGSIGLMNTRSNSLVSKNSASAYLTIGMGVRTQFPESYRPALEQQPSGNFFALRDRNFKEIKRVIEKDMPNYRVGRLGNIAKDYGINVALLGNADTDVPVNNSFFIAADSQGYVKTANIHKDNLLTRDKDFVWGHRTDIDKLMMYSLKAIEKNELIFIDYGDTVRIEEAGRRLKIPEQRFKELKKETLKQADEFIGRLIKEIKTDKFSLIVLSPNVSQYQSKKGNKTLSPIIIYDGITSGILTSGTTKRQGLVANIDIGPTIFAKFGINENELNYIGENIVSRPEKNNYKIISDILSGYLYLKTSRYIIHGLYITMLISALAVLYMPYLKKRRIATRRVGRCLALSVLALPVSSFIISASLNYRFKYIDLILSILMIAFIAVRLSKTKKLAIKSMGWLGFFTSVFIVTALLSRSGVLLQTPLGFNDVFMGGRYYGINNDCMGILLGSTIFAIFYFFDRFKIGRAKGFILGTFLLIPVVLSQTPLFGANVGGTIAAMTTGIIALVTLASGQPLTKQKVLLTVVLVFIIELGIAYIDNLAGGQTHAGKVMNALIKQGFSAKFIEVLSSKLSLFFLMLVIPPWNLMFAVQTYIYILINRKYGMSLIKRVQDKMPVLSGSFNVLFYGGIVALIFNDTGIIATSLMFIYLTIPLGVMLAENHEISQE